MTAKGCPVCHDQRRDQIALALLTDGPKKVAQRFGLKLSEISYHRRHLPREIARQREVLARETDEPATVLAHVEKLLRTAERIVRDARLERDWSAATGALREARACLELLARLRGELQAGAQVQVGLQVNVAGGGAPTSAEELDWLIAVRVAEATQGFDPQEIARLREVANRCLVGLTE
jgi:hypothetical protein